MGLTSVKEKKESRSARILKNYNLNIRYQYQPTGWITKNLPLLVAPIFSSTIVFILIAIFVGYVTITTPQIASLSGKEKGEIAAITAFMIFTPNFFLHYLLNSIIVYPVARFNKFKTSRSPFLLICLNIFVVLAIIIYTTTSAFNTSILKYNNISAIFLTSWFFISGAFTTFTFRNFNELYKRDVEGKIIMSDKTKPKEKKKKEK